MLVVLVQSVQLVQLAQVAHLDIGVPSGQQKTKRLHQQTLLTQSPSIMLTLTLLGLVLFLALVLLLQMLVFIALHFLFNG
jgi:hypothetical protein